jgi:hypothetical protein
MAAVSIQVLITEVATARLCVCDSLAQHVEAVHEIMPLAVASLQRQAPR